MNVVDAQRNGCDALVVAKTPLQILNASEAREHFQFRQPALRLLTSRKFPAELLLSLVDTAEWSSVDCYEFDPVRRPIRLPVVGESANEELTEIRWVFQQWRHRRRYDAFFRPWRGVPNLVIGNYHQEFFVHLANRCGSPRCILVDDGTDTFHVAGVRRERSEGHLDVPPRPNFWQAPKHWWFSSEVAWDHAHLDELVFFSTYDLELPASDTLVRNRYPRASRRAGDAARDGRALFLGQPLVEDGYLDLEAFRTILTGVRESFAGQPLAYVPHPRENRDILRETLAACDLPMQEISKPFEFHLLESATLPSAVASFFSSALDNCRLIWGDRMRLLAYRLPSEHLRVGHEFVEEVYRYFDHKGSIEILEPGQRVSD